MTDAELRLECIKIALSNKNVKVEGYTKAQADYEGIPYPTIVAEHIKHYIKTGETKYSNAFLSFLENETLVNTLDYENMRAELKQLIIENSQLKEKKKGCLICRLLHL